MEELQVSPVPQGCPVGQQASPSPPQSASQAIRVVLHLSPELHGVPEVQHGPPSPPQLIQVIEAVQTKFALLQTGSEPQQR